MKQVCDERAAEVRRAEPPAHGAGRSSACRKYSRKLHVGMRARGGSDHTCSWEKGLPQRHAPRTQPAISHRLPWLPQAITFSALP
jgi:hypothetical protein